MVPLPFSDDDLAFELKPPEKLSNFDPRHRNTWGDRWTISLTFQPTLHKCHMGSVYH